MKLCTLYMNGIKKIMHNFPYCTFGMHHMLTWQFFNIKLQSILWALWGFPSTTFMKTVDNLIQFNCVVAAHNSPFFWCCCWGNLIGVGLISIINKNRCFCLKITLINCQTIYQLIVSIFPKYFTHFRNNFSSNLREICHKYLIYLFTSK